MAWQELLKKDYGVLLQTEKSLKPCGFRLFYEVGRSSGIRTHGLLDPNQARYQTALYPVGKKYFRIVKIPITRIGILIVAARLGFEPRQTESESVVLPLHNRAICRVDRINVYYYNAFFENVNTFFQKNKNFLNEDFHITSWQMCTDMV